MVQTLGLHGSNSGRCYKSTFLARFPFSSSHPPIIAWNADVQRAERIGGWRIHPPIILPSNLTTEASSPQSFPTYRSIYFWTRLQRHTLKERTPHSDHRLENFTNDTNNDSLCSLWWIQYIRVIRAIRVRLLQKPQKHHSWWLWPSALRPVLPSLCLRASSCTDRKPSTVLFQNTAFMVAKTSPFGLKNRNLKH